MGNMSYCQFENTAADLGACVDSLREDGLPKSLSERDAVRRITGLCKQFIAAAEDFIEDEEE